MRDEEYRPDQVGDYGLRAQPAIVARMSSQLTMTKIGNGLALLAIIAAVIGLVVYPRFPGENNAMAITTLVGAVVMLIICTFQLVVWMLAMREWRGERDYDLEPLMKISWVVHLLSYVVAIVTIWSALAASVQAGVNATSSTLIMISLLLTLAAQISAGVQYVRTSGPPGTLPNHMRQLIMRSKRR